MMFYSKFYPSMNAVALPERYHFQQFYPTPPLPYAYKFCLASLVGFPFPVSLRNCSTLSCYHSNIYTVQKHNFYYLFKELDLNLVLHTKLIYMRRNSALPSASSMHSEQYIDQMTHLVT